MSTQVRVLLLIFLAFGLSSSAWSGGYTFTLQGADSKVSATCEAECAWRALSYSCPNSECTIGMDQSGIGAFHAKKDWHVLLDLTPKSADVKITCQVPKCSVDGKFDGKPVDKKMSRGESVTVRLPVQVTCRFQ